MVDKPANAEVLELSWDMVHTLCKSLCYRIQGSPLKQASSIVPIMRGGLIPATILSHILDIPLFHKADRNEKELIVDDISDTGATFSVCQRASPFSFKVCLVAKPRGIPFCDAYVMQVPQHIWVKWPWEVE